MVSVIVTAYNVEAWIEEALHSVFNQSFPEIEVIVVEDCSTDNTRDVLAGIADPRLRVLYNRENIGAGASRRRGIEAARGEYILLLDGDDWLAEDYIEELYAKAVAYEADIVSGGITVRREDGTWEAHSCGDAVVEGDDKMERFWNEKVVFMNNKLIRRSLHDKVPYCTRRFIEDTPVIVPMLHLANRVVYTDNAGYNYRQNSESLTHQASPFKYTLFRALCADDIITFFEHNDEAVLKRLPLVEAYSQCIKELKECAPTAAMIEPYRNEWIEFTTKLLQRICN